MTAFFKNRRGSVTIMAVMILLVLGGLMAAASPMIINEVKMNTVNRDMIEAQYAAEAGAKVGIAAIYGNKEEWSWLGNAFSLTSGATNKTYSVTITPALTGAPEAGKEYTITSIGTVNGSIKKVSVKVKAGGSGMPAALSSIVFGNANIIMNNSAKIYGSAGTNGYISMTSSSNEITGVATYNTNVQKSSSGTYNYPITSVGSENGVSTTLAVPTFTVTFTAPTAPATPTVPSSTSSWDSLVGTWQVTKSVSSGNYSTSGNLQSGQSTITTAANTGIYVNGGASFYKSTWSMGNNTLMYMKNGGLSLTGATAMSLGSGSEIYMTGFLDVDQSLIMGANSTLYAGLGMQLEASSTVTMPGAAYIYLANNSSNNVSGYSWIANNKSTLNLGTLGQASVLYCNGSANLGGKVNIYGPTSGTETTKIYLTGNMDFNNDAVINIDGNVEVYISGTMKINNSVQIITTDNSKVTFKVGGYSELNSSATITTGKNSAFALLIDSDAHFTNNTVINKAVVIATGNITMDSSASIIGSVVSTGTTITMSNQAQITTDPDTVALVWNNILSTSTSSGSSGSSGSSSFEIISWQK
jgi:hypothetical protein